MIAALIVVAVLGQSIDLSTPSSAAGSLFGTGLVGLGIFVAWRSMREDRRDLAKVRKRAEEDVADAKAEAGVWRDAYLTMHSEITLAMGLGFTDAARQRLADKLTHPSAITAKATERPSSDGS